MKKIISGIGVVLIGSLMAHGAQDISGARYSLSCDNIDLGSALVQLQQQADIDLTFNCEWVEDFLVTCSFENYTLVEAVEQLLGGLGYATVYDVDDDMNVTGMTVSVAEPDFEAMQEEMAHIKMDEEQFMPGVALDDLEALLYREQMNSAVPSSIVMPEGTVISDVALRNMKIAQVPQPELFPAESNRVAIVEKEADKATGGLPVTEDVDVVFPGEDGATITVEQVRQLIEDQEDAVLY